MPNKQNISGIHHITAVASSAVDNLTFYEKTLGLRLVKQTVNFDDPFTYHLYYGDGQGSPGTILTFFPWENLPQGRSGAGMVTAIAFSITRNSIDFWTQRLSSFGINVNTEVRFGDPVVRFSDPHGLPIELIGISQRLSTVFWKDGPIVEAHAITGFHSATATLNRLDEKKGLLMDVLGMTLKGREDNRYRFEMENHAAPGHFYDVVFDPKVPNGKPGDGTVHHIAFRTDDDKSQAGWQSTLKKSGLGVTDVRDRNYFRSIYFHSPGGVLFEIATDPPGFTVDENLDELGASLKLPNQHEHMRDNIERQLPPLRDRQFHHVFKEPQLPADNGQTIVTLHGTGGNENDLIGIARDVSPASALLSPRGQVIENGMLRFFKRLAENVFDEKDVAGRADDLADFIVTAAAEYGRDPAQLTAMGYSNGANIAAAIILLRPEVFNRAVLLRPMLPLQDSAAPELGGKEILILRGENDLVIPSESTDRLVETFKNAGASVTVRKLSAGHEITARDLQEITQWVSKTHTHSQEISEEIPAEGII
jgi:predicted esterase/catechol 2,3-dioxygenase-like lactoylglutathione lyase family enzyme